MAASEPPGGPLPSPQRSNDAYDRRWGSGRPVGEAPGSSLQCGWISVVSGSPRSGFPVRYCSGTRVRRIGVLHGRKKKSELAAESRPCGSDAAKLVGTNSGEDERGGTSVGLRRTCRKELADVGRSTRHTSSIWHFPLAADQELFERAGFVRRGGKGTRHPTRRRPRPVICWY
ncbi:hypothetical protein VUR80DRAFT_228 [Thermomyces stellatus]